MTEKLYYKDSYLKECDSEVLEVKKNKDKILVVLDKTIFYPEGGGQPSDIGSINNVNVLYVYEENDIIYHEVEKEINLGKVHCKIDFHKRFDHMQQHSGEHILSGIIHKVYGGNNKGFHLGEEYVTIDIDINFDDFTEEKLNYIEEEVNNAIYINEEFVTYIVSKEGLDKTHSRKKINVEGDIRIVEAKEIDCCPCCGTHVKKTGEIGIIKILKSERYKGMTRIYLKCGKRALKDFKLKHDVITSLGKILSTDEISIVERFEKQLDEFSNLKRELVTFKSKYAETEANKLMEEAVNGFIHKSFEDKSFEDIQFIGETLNNKGYIFILTSLCDKKILMVNNNLNKSLNCGNLFKENIRKFNGKGGGKDKRAQGSFGNSDDLIKFHNSLVEIIKNNQD